MIGDRVRNPPMNGVYLLPGALGQRPWTRRLAQGIEARLVAHLAGRLRRQPLEAAQAAARRQFARLGPRTPLHRELVANLAVLHPAATTDQLESKAQRTWGWLGVTFAEIVHAGALAASVGERVELDVAPEVDAILRAPGHAAVLASAHVGPWMLCNLIGAQHRFPLTTTLPSTGNDGVDALLREAMRLMPVEKVSLEDSYAPLAAEIGRGHKVFLAVDGWNDDGHAVGLFGERMRLDPTAAQLAVHHACPLIPIHALRLPGGRYRVIAKRVLTPDGSIDSETDRAKQLTEAFATDLERWIREVPGQWLCLTPRWADETIWGALTRATDRTRRADERVSDDDLDRTLSGQVAGTAPKTD
jgi:KDO2-lipid IV(A) lauroyltransferase